MEQKSKEWLSARLGKITASEVHKIMGAKGFGDKGLAYINKVGGESFLDSEKLDDYFLLQPNTLPMKWGTEWEPIARKHYEKCFNVKIEEVGFVVWSENNMAGCSPDGLDRETKIGFEIKCPMTVENHYEMLSINSQEEFKKVRTDYYWQIMMCMLVTGFKKWVFISFHPCFKESHKMITFEIAWEQKDIDLLKIRIGEACKKLAIMPVQYSEK